MSLSKASLLVIGLGSIGLALAVARLAGAAPTPLADLGNNEGIFVDMKTFKVLRGTAKTDPAAQIQKLGARPVNDGAIIFRSGDTLYIVDAVPGGGPMFLLFQDAWGPG
jgi:threonine dehydrogenase-like Zn-dependent dehydrogenase